MERFNIALFKEQQQKGEYSHRLSDGSLVEQFRIGEGYGEKETPQKGWFYTYKEFYANGVLQTKGRNFIKGDFKVGEWIECDEEGRVTDKKNYDNGYKLDVFGVIDILKAKQIHFSLENPNDKITRNIKDGRHTWFVSRMIGYTSIDTIEIDDSSGKIVNQTSMKFRAVN